jgi:hypothetical protein
VVLVGAAGHAAAVRGEAVRDVGAGVIGDCRSADLGNVRPEVLQRVGLRRLTGSGGLVRSVFVAAEHVGTSGCQRDEGPATVSLSVYTGGRPQ